MILPYLLKNFALNRVVEIEGAFQSAIESLEHQPNRGSIELYLGSFQEGFRYILFRETRFFELKIIYHVDEDSAKVLVVDFFPTPMHPKRMIMPK